MVLLTPPPSPASSLKAIKIDRFLSGKFQDASPAKEASSPFASDERRWSVLAVFCAASFMGALVWNILSPVFYIAQQKFGTGAEEIKCAHGWPPPPPLTFPRSALAMSYYIWYCPGTVFALWMMERHGLRKSLLLGFLTQVVMILLSVIGCTLAGPASYWTVWAGTLVGSFGQPLFMNNVTRLAADWFPINERDMAVTTAVVARALGVMIISASAPFIVHQPSQIVLLYYWQVPVWLLILLAGAWVCADRPPMPPSASAATLWATEDEAAAVPLPEGGSYAARALNDIWLHTLSLMRLPNFLWVAVSYSLITGVGWAFLTVVGQFLEPCGYSTYVAGFANAVFMGATALGCFAAAPTVEATRAYLPMQRFVSWSTLAACAAVLAMARPGHAAGVLVAWAALGFTMGPLTPISFEHAVEMTYPVPAQASSAILIVLSNLLGFIETVVVTKLLQRGASPTCADAWTPAAAFTLGCVAVGSAMTTLVNKDYRRQAAEGVTAGDPWGDGEEKYEARVKPGNLPGEPARRSVRTPLLS